MPFQVIPRKTEGALLEDEAGRGSALTDQVFSYFRFVGDESPEPCNAGSRIPRSEEFQDQRLSPGSAALEVGTRYRIEVLRRLVFGERAVTEHDEADPETRSTI